MMHANVQRSKHLWWFITSSVVGSTIVRAVWLFYLPSGCVLAACCLLSCCCGGILTTLFFYVIHDTTVKRPITSMDDSRVLVTDQSLRRKNPRWCPTPIYLALSSQKGISICLIIIEDTMGMVEVRGIRIEIIIMSFQVCCSSPTFFLLLRVTFQALQTHICGVTF